MRYTMIAVLLCACAHFTPVNRPTSAEAEANYQEFYKEFTAGRHSEAKIIADKKKVDRHKVVKVVLAAMGQQVVGGGVISEAKEISRKFKIDRATELAFAQNAFDFSILNRHCDIAADIAFFFNLGSTYADGAINCAVSKYGMSLPFSSYAARVACSRTGTKNLQSKLIAEWLEAFQQSERDHNDYVSIEEIVTLCPINAKQYSDLFAISLGDRQLDFTLVVITAIVQNNDVIMDTQPLYRLLYQAVFDTPLTKTGASVLADKLRGINRDPLSPMKKLMLAKEMLETADFKKVPADYTIFIVASVANFQCGFAVNTMLEQKLPDEVVEALFLNPKCLGGTLIELNMDLISPEKVDWFFDLSLQAHEYVLAKDLIDRFVITDETYFTRIVDAAMAVRDFDVIVELDPPAGWDKRIYRDNIMDQIMDLGEEWFVVRYATSKISIYQYSNTENWYAWIERAYLHALHRGAFELAAEISSKSRAIEYRLWGIDLAFELACKTNLKEAEAIARRYLDKAALNRVVLLKYKKLRAEDKQRKTRDCQEGDDWCVQQVK